MRKVVEPTESKGSHDERRFHHPAFGQISAARVQSTGHVLYGSDFIHHHFIVIRIKRSELVRGLSYDRHHSHDELVEVWLSEAQWATFVSSLNAGDGVACTIANVARKPTPGIPLRQQSDVFQDEADKTIAATLRHLDESIKAVEGELGAGLSQKKRDAILAHMKLARRKLEDSLPFVATSMRTYMETMVEKAKTEVYAWMQNAVHRAGMTKLTGKDAPLQLGSGEQDGTTL